MALLNLTNISLTDPVVSGANHILPKLPAALVALLFGFVLIRIVSWISQLLLNFIRMPRGLRGIVTSLIDALLGVFLIIAVLQSLGLTSIALVFSGSIAVLGLALASGASTLTADVLAGIFLARDRDFSVGDLVKAGDPPIEGIVESMDMRRTRIRDDKGKLHIIPNSVIERKEWVLLAKRHELKEK